MDNFLHRERAMETKFQHEQFLEYKILARRNRLFGLWIAGILGLEDIAAETYARGVVSGHFCTPGAETLLEKVFQDLEAASLEMSPHLVRKQLEYCLKDANMQIHAE
jgi:hypothetical protein